MQLTIPQIVMMNHAAYIEHKNSEIKYEHKRAVEGRQRDRAETDPYIDEFGAPLSELEGADLNTYLSDWSIG